MAETGDIGKSIIFGPTIRPVSTTVIHGTPEQPLVASLKWPNGEVEKKRIINSERSFQIPTFIFWDETVTTAQQGVIREAFTELFRATGFDPAKISYLGNWREQDFKDPDGKLKPHKSIEWQVQSKWNASRRQVNAEDVLTSMFFDPYQTTDPHWEVIFTNKDLFVGNTNFVIGGAQPDLGTLISLGRLESIRDTALRGETQKTEIFHEFGHVLNLPTNRRGRNNLDHSLGDHCLSPGCSMKQGLNVPDDWITFTTSRLRSGGRPFCGDCIKDLSVKFKK